MEFINEQIFENSFMINVRHVKNKLEILDNEVIKEYRLSDGNMAHFISTKGANLLVFEKDNLQYRFSIDKRISHKITPEKLVQIANSIHY